MTTVWGLVEKGNIVAFEQVLGTWEVLDIEQGYPDEDTLVFTVRSVESGREDMATKAPFEVAHVIHDKRPR